jgi:ABC-type glucose/galactose transport system permease subunit
MVLFYTVLFWVAELFWQTSAEAELGRTSQIRRNPNFGTELRHIASCNMGHLQIVQGVAEMQDK